MIQPQVLLRLPCYDFTPPVAESTVEGSYFSIPPASNEFNSHGVTGGEYKTRERIHRSIADLRLLAIPTSSTRVAECYPNWEAFLRFAPPRGIAALCMPPHCSTCVALDVRAMILDVVHTFLLVAQAVSLEFSPEVLATNDVGCARCGT